jgi:hypothetical protein
VALGSDYDCAWRDRMILVVNQAKFDVDFTNIDGQRSHRSPFINDLNHLVWINGLLGSNLRWYV